MPVAAAIRAPIACIKVGAVKRLVVESVCHSVCSPLAVSNSLCDTSYRWAYVLAGVPTNLPSRCSTLSVEVGLYVYFEQVRVPKAGYLRLNILCMG